MAQLERLTTFLDWQSGQPINGGQGFAHLLEMTQLAGDDGATQSALVRSQQGALEQDLGPSMVN